MSLLLSQTGLICYCYGIAVIIIIEVHAFDTPLHSEQILGLVQPLKVHHSCLYFILGSIVSEANHHTEVGSGSVRSGRSPGLILCPGGRSHCYCQLGIGVSIIEGVQYVHAGGDISGPGKCFTVDEVCLCLGSISQIVLRIVVTIVVQLVLPF